MKYLLTAFCAFVLFSCSDDDHSGDNPESDIASRTVIIYISGENSLSSFAPGDLSEMAEASTAIGDNNHLVVFFDNASSTEMPYIAELKDGEVVKDKQYEEDFLASDPDRMREVLTYIMQRWPAKSYGIDLWGHASGWLITGDTIATTQAATRAYGIDNGMNTTSDRGKWINMTMMARVFEQLPGKFLFVVGDCCFFQCVESAYELKDCADYIFGCPSEVPGYGGAYQTIIPLFFNQSATFYNDIIDTCRDMIGDESFGVPMSVIRTSALDRFAAATAKIMPDLLKYDNFSGKRLVYYGIFIDDKGKTAKGYYDPKNLVLEYAADSPYRQEWENALNDLIPNRIWCREWDTQFLNHGLNFSSFDVSEQTCSGMCMFVPQPMYESLSPNPNESIKQMKWAKAVGLD